MEKMAAWAWKVDPEELREAEGFAKAHHNKLASDLKAAGEADRAPNSSARPTKQRKYDLAASASLTTRAFAESKV